MTANTGERAKLVSPFHTLTTTEEREGAGLPWADSAPQFVPSGYASDTLADCLPIRTACGTRAQAAGPMLREVQGLLDMERARAQAAKLVRSMARRGWRGDKEQTTQDATGAGLLALLQWREGAGDEPSAAAACWRAILASVGSDGMGDTVTLSDFTEEALAGSLLPLPSLLGDDTRTDKANRLTFERARAKRGDRLAVRIDHIKAIRGGRGKRAEVIDKVHRAAIGLLQGVSLGDAASASGFTGSGRTDAGDRLAQAVRRLGFRVQLNARQSTAQAAKRVHHSTKPLPASIPAAWAANPSATIGKLSTGADKLRKIRQRTKRFNARQIRGLRAVQRAARIAQRAARRQARQHAQARQVKAAGLLAGGRGSMGFTPGARRYMGGGQTVRWSRAIAQAR